MEYTTERNSKGGIRFDVRNPPETGTELKTTSGEDVIFDEVSFAGMLACTRKSDGSQQLYFPHDLMGANQSYPTRRKQIDELDPVAWHFSGKPLYILEGIKK